MDTPSIAVHSERRGAFLVRTLRISIPSLPAAFEGYRMAHLSDFHLGPATSVEHLRSAFTITRELEPQLFLLNGDYVQNARIGLNQTLKNRVHPKVFGWTNYRRGVRLLAEQLGELIAKSAPPDGVFAVFGNHDYMEGIGSIVRKFPKDVRWLTNTWTGVQKGDSQIVIAGIDDINRGKPDLANALRGLAPEPGAAQKTDASFRILLSHNPDVTIHREAPLLEHVDLVLCGHTHGGQICLPVWGPIVTRTRQSLHTRGLSHHGKTPIYTSTGVGYGAIGLRLLCPPEITMIELRSGK